MNKENRKQTLMQKSVGELIDAIIGYERKEHALNSHLAQVVPEPVPVMKNIHNDVPPLGVELLCYNSNLKVYYSCIRKDEYTYSQGTYMVAPPDYWMLMPEKEPYKK